MDTPAIVAYGRSERRINPSRGLWRGLWLVALLALSTGPAFAQTSYPDFNSPIEAQPEVKLPPPAPPFAPNFLAPNLGSGMAGPPDGSAGAQNLAPETSVSRAIPLARKPSRRRATRNQDSAAQGSAVAQGGAPSFSPETAELTRQAAARYAQIVRAGGWPIVPAAVGPGSNGSDVGLLRKRLAVEGYLSAAQTVDLLSPGDGWSADLTAAVKRFQMSLGLRETGVVSGPTLKALNVSASERYRQLAATANRLQAVSFSFGNLYVDVNIPSETVEAVQNGKVAHRYIAVVGGPDHRSPEIAAQIQAINVNPTWTVPTSIIKHEIIPKLRKDPNYLAREHIRVLDPSGQEVDPRDVNWDSEHALSYTLRQDSGPHNSLGSLRINMPNKEAVYMHDTPAKGLFNKEYRFLSHGCVRVDGVYDLAAWLLRSTGNSRWSKAALLSAVASTERRDINLRRSVPVIWVYMTGWADPSGTVHFRNDVYHEDEGAEAMVHADLR